MEIEIPHRTTSTSELFICFTSRLSSSSMKISSKSILSPSRAREPSQISLTSLSRRLKKSGSIKGGQASPMFPTGGKKRGSAFENPEPSSPKVTCIGQVRVKTKKQGKKMRTGSQRRGEASLRKTEQSNFQSLVGQEHHGRETYQGFQFQNPQHECLPHRNQKWVHLPMTICEALKTLGAEFNCFLPCRSSCMTSEKDKEDKGVRSENGSSCGAVFARWLVALQDKDGKGQEIELVVGEEERTETSTSQRRQMFEGIEFNEEFKENNEEEEARVPPKNALLLMRCRSDPVKMAALANRLWESPVPPNEEGNEDEKDDYRDKETVQRDMEEGQDVRVKVEEVAETELCESEKMYERCELSSCEEQEDTQEQENSIMEVDEKEENIEEKVNQIVSEIPERNIQLEIYELDELKEESKDETDGLEKDSKDAIDGLEEDCTDEIDGSQEDCKDPGQVGSRDQKEEEQEFEANPVAESTKEAAFIDVFSKNLAGNSEKIEELNESALVDENEHVKEPRFEDEEVENRASFHSEQKAEVEAKVSEESPEDKEILNIMTQQRSETEYPNTRELAVGPKSKVLPDCLLLMMCEPKLSMEVSKETWICSTDFIRWLPERDRNRKVKKSDSSDEPKKRLSISNNKDFKPAHSTHPAQQKMQPPRASCSLPVAPASMASMIEQKLLGSKAYEPFVLTRCKSEPMRSSAKLAQQEGCFWKNRKLEPQSSATLGVGAAGVGF